VFEREHGLFPELSYAELVERLERLDEVIKEKESLKPLTIQEK
jgi:hypothetical protein